MRRDPFSLIEQKLSAAGCDPKRSGEHLYAKCPAHDDSNPSLSVGRGQSHPVVIKCQTGCTTEDILGALDLEWADVCEPRKSNGLGDEEARYRYRRADGTHAYDIVRFHPPDQKKTFRVQLPDGRWGLNKTTPVPYRLPELVAAATAGARVYIAEGEKDCDALVRAGAAATCNPFGAGKWADRYSPYLNGAEVVIVADRDTAGAEHALEVAASLGLCATPMSVAIVEAATGKDAADHLAAGRTLDDFAPVSAEELRARLTVDVHDDQADDDEDGPKDRKSIATQLVELAEAHYELGISSDGLAFGIDGNGPNIAHPLRGGRLGLRAALADAFMATTGKAASSGALADALLVVEGRCRHHEPVDLYHRVAPFGDGIVVDLGTADGRAVLIEPAGWKILERSPVTFRRSELTQPLPEPQRGDPCLLDEPVGNVSADSWPLVVGWLVAALLPSIPHPALLLRGEQGVGKSTMAMALGSLIDPTAAPLRSAPRDIEQWAVAASGSWVVALDNLSGVAGWFSDALCRAVTGEGLVRRKLYSDDDVSVLCFRRVIMLTAIDAGALRGDLADRLLSVDLEPIEAARRRTDADLGRQRTERLPALLGALYDLTAEVLAVLPSVELDEMPRMADFAKVLAALDRVRPCAANDRLSLYRSLGDDLARDVVEGDPFAAAVADLARAQGTWRGTAGQLGEKVAVPDPRPKDWPRTPRGIGGALRRVSPALRAIGIGVEHTKSAGTGCRKEILLRADQEPAT